MSTTAPPRPEAMPRRMALAIAVLLVGALLSVATVRLTGTNVRAPDAPTLQLRELRFEDLPDGGIAVIDAANGAVIHRVQGEAGFLRGTLRALARERAKRGLGPEAPFQLLARVDGRLTLADPATGERIDLESFGPTNAAVFARLLALPSPR